MIILVKRNMFHETGDKNWDLVDEPGKLKFAFFPDSFVGCCWTFEVHFVGKRCVIEISKKILKGCCGSLDKKEDYEVAMEVKHFTHPSNYENRSCTTVVKLEF